MEQNIYSQEQLLEMDVHNARAILGKDKTLTAKYSIVNLALKRIKQHLKLVSTKEYTEEELEDEHKFVNLIELAENGQWQNVITELTKNEYPSKTIDFIMVYAIEQKKDINLILQLYNFNSYFSTAFMHAVVKRNDVNLARILVSHGLDFTQSNELGANAVYTAVLHRKIAMLRYLINEGIKVKPYEFGLDPLDIALKNLKLDLSSFNFVTILIEAGAPIEPSHKEKALEFSQSNIELYLKLIIRFPMLKSHSNT